MKKIAIDACSVILLAKATILETFSKKYNLFATEKVYKEILEGKDKKFADALLTERLVKEQKINVANVVNNDLIKKLMADFNLGIGEAETLVLVLEKQCEIIVTDNRQGRKAALIYGLNLVGSVDVLIALHKLSLIDRDKAVNGLKRLKEFGWFQDYLIDIAMEEVKNA